MIPPPPPSGYWPHGAAATAYLARVEKLLKYRGLEGTAPHFKPFMRAIVAAFEARDIDGVTAGVTRWSMRSKGRPAGPGRERRRDSVRNSSPAEMARRHQQRGLRRPGRGFGYQVRRRPTRTLAADHPRPPLGGRRRRAVRSRYGSSTGAGVPSSPGCPLWRTRARRTTSGWNTLARTPRGGASRRV